MPVSSFSFPFSSAFGSGFSFVPIGPGGTPLSALNATPATALSQIDQLIDPVTGDYVRTDNGEWAETADARTMVQLMLDLEHGASPFDPNDGTTIRARLRNGDPVTPEELRDEAARVGEILQRAGVLSNFQVAVRDTLGRPLRDASGRQLVQLDWRDLTSGSPVNIVLQPG